MNTTVLAGIIIVIVVLAGAVLFAVSDTRRRQRANSQQRFGPKYEREVQVYGSERDAEQRLSKVADRRDRLDIRHLEPAACDRYTEAGDLLKILIAQRRPIPRKHLIELLWPEADPAVADNRLSVLLSTVRNALQPQGRAGLLTSDGAVVWLDLTQITVGVEEFLTHAKAALNAR